MPKFWVLSGATSPTGTAVSAPSVESWIGIKQSGDKPWSLPILRAHRRGSVSQHALTQPHPPFFPVNQWEVSGLTGVMDT